MMAEKTLKEGTWIVEESVDLRSLTIAEGACLEAPVMGDVGSKTTLNFIDFF